MYTLPNIEELELAFLGMFSEMKTDEWLSLNHIFIRCGTKYNDEERRAALGSLIEKGFIEQKKQDTFFLTKDGFDFMQGRAG